MECQTQGVECLMLNLANVEAIANQLDHLPFADALWVSPPNVGDAEVAIVSVIAFVCVDQVMVCVACIH